MGLLLGDVVETASGAKETLVWRAVPQIRNDRRKARSLCYPGVNSTTSKASCTFCRKVSGRNRCWCRFLCAGDTCSAVATQHQPMPMPSAHPCIALQDRVECSGTQMAEVASYAEQLTQETGRRTRVVGWYHSHPHITVMPSHVDVNTQVSATLSPLHLALIIMVDLSDTNRQAFSPRAYNQGSVGPSGACGAGELPGAGRGFRGAHRIVLQPHARRGGGRPGGSACIPGRRCAGGCRPRRSGCRRG
jgi:proteasome lid subunit RPN8/RPN11